MADGDRQVGAGQHRPVVEAVAHHRDAVALALLQACTRASLSSGDCRPSTDPMPARRASRCAAAVRSPESTCTRRPCAAAGARPPRGGVLAQAARRARSWRASPARRPGGPAPPPAASAGASQKAAEPRRSAARVPAEPHGAAQPLARDFPHVEGFQLARAAPPTRPARATADAANARASAAAQLQRGIAVAAPSRVLHVRDRHAVAGQRAGLVEHHRVDARAVLQRLEAAHQDAAARQRAGRGQRRGRRGQRQRAGTGHDQHGHGDAHRVPRPGRPPPPRRQRRRREHAQQERSRRCGRPGAPAAACRPRRAPSGPRCRRSACPRRARSTRTSTAPRGCGCRR